MGLVKVHSAKVAKKRRRARRCRVLMVDETSIRKRHRYVTVVASGGHRRGASNDPRPHKRLSEQVLQGPRTRLVQVVVSDGSRSYQAAIAQYLPDAQHVLDRFHIARSLTRRAHPRPTRAPTPRLPRTAADVRTGPVQSPVHPAAAGGSPHRRPPQASGSAVEAHPRLRTASEALQEPAASSTKPTTPTAPTKALGPFADLYATGQTPRIRRSSQTPSSPAVEELLAYHTTKRVSNGPLEGINNLLQVLRRVAHGFTNRSKLHSPPNPRNAARGILVT